METFLWEFVIIDYPYVVFCVKPVFVNANKLRNSTPFVIAGAMLPPSGRGAVCGADWGSYPQTSHK